MNAQQIAERTARISEYEARRLREEAAELATRMAFVPVVGMGVTINGWSDCHACTITAVSKSGNTITLQQDKATLLNGVNSDAEDRLGFSPGGFVGHYYGTQRWQIERDENGMIYKASRRKDGRWRLAGDTKSGKAITMDCRYEHYDFNF